MVGGILKKWGHRSRLRSLGYVADYCRICRGVTPHEVSEQMASSQVLFFVLEPEALAGHTQVCEGCETVSRCKTTQFTAFQESPGGSIEALIAATFPNVREFYGEQLRVDEKIASGSDDVDPATRQRLIMEVFGMSEPHFRKSGPHGLHFVGVAMRPLRPTEDEIRACIERYQNSRSRLGGVLHLAEVMVAIYPERAVKKPGQYSY
jgi:hypothetical protein